MSFTLRFWKCKRVPCTGLFPSVSTFPRRTHVINLEEVTKSALFNNFDKKIKWIVLLSASRAGSN